MSSGNTRSEIIHSIEALLDTGQGVLVVGALGVGKSHLLRELATRLPNGHVELLIGSPAVRSIPFGSVAHVMPEKTVSDPLRLLQLARKALLRRAHPRQLVLVVDDLDQIDDGSQALVLQLAASRTALVLAAVRDEHAADPRVSVFWKDHHLHRYDLASLTRGEHDRLVAGLSPTPLPHAAVERIWDLTKGNPLFAREIVLGLPDAATVDDETIAGALLGSERLRDYARHRLEGLSPLQRRALSSIALTEPLDQRVVDRLSDAPTLETLHQFQLVLTEITEDQTVLRTTHPLLAELLRADMAPRTRATLLTEVAVETLALDQPQQGADLRVATWLLEADLPLDSEHAHRAARAALRVFDADLAVRSSSLAMTGERSLEHLITHGHALSLAGRVDDADAVLVEAESVTSDQSILGTIAVTRALNLMHRGGRTAEAVTLLTRRAAELTDPSARANIESMLMQGEGLEGDFRRALEVGPELLDEVGSGDVGELRLLVSVGVARLVTGHLDGVEEELTRGLALAEKLSDDHPIEADQMALNAMLYELSRPDFTAALRLVDRRLASSSGAGEGPWLYLAGWAFSAAGRLDRARLAASAGLESLAAVDPIGLRVLALGVHALVLAQSGIHDEAAEALGEAGADPRSAQPRSEMFLARANAWLLAHENPRAAAGLAAAHGAILSDRWHQTWGAWCAFDAVRFGHGELVVDQLERAAADSGDGAVALFATHARALADRDLDSLHEVALRWESAGSPAHAAEAVAGAATVTSGESGAWSSQRALVLQTACPGLASPFLAAVEAPLSARELEIATLASTGRSSRDIADELFISRRTVDNHLGAVYGRLGLSGRTELAHLFRVTQSDAVGYSIAG